MKRACASNTSNRRPHFWQPPRIADSPPIAGSYAGCRAQRARNRIEPNLSMKFYLRRPIADTIRNWVLSRRKE